MDRVRDYDPQSINGQNTGWPAVIEIAQMVRAIVRNAVIVVVTMSIYAKESLLGLF